MKLFYLIIIFLALFQPINSQIKVSGCVTDSQSGDVIPYVIVCDKNEKVLTQTDLTGHYSIEIPNPASIHFIHLAYDSASVWLDSEIKFCNVALKLHEIGLNEIVITPDYANKLLTTAYMNLRKRLELGQSREYMFYDKESSTTGGERESYALIEGGIKSIDKKNGTIKWDLNLTGLNVINKTDKENFFINKFQFWYLPEKFGIRPDFSGDNCEILETDDDLLTIKAVPKHPDSKNHVYFLSTIDMVDTIVIKVVQQAFPNSSELTQKKYKGTNWNLSNTFINMKFEENTIDSKYFIAECQVNETIQIGSGSTAYPIFFHTDFSIQKNKNIEIKPLRKKKAIKPYTYPIYEVDVSD